VTSGAIASPSQLALPELVWPANEAVPSIFSFAR